MLLYAALGVADLYLMVHYGRQPLDQGPDGEGKDDGVGGDGPGRHAVPAGDAPPDESEAPRAPALIY